MMTLIQGSAEWKQARLGRVTASRIADVVARTKSGPSASRASYAAQLVAERLTGIPHEGYVSAEMQHGTDTEREACAAYEFYSGNTVVATGFISHPVIEMAGASPDGLVGEGIVEIKSPSTHTHIETLRGQSVPKKYVDQIQWQLACTGRHWCDFVSYDNRMPENMRFFSKYIHRDDGRIAELEAEVIRFLAEVDATIIDLRRLHDPDSNSKALPILKAG